jgi:hypothetical protein
LAGPTPESISRGLGSGWRPWKMGSRGPRGIRLSRLLGPDSRRRSWRRWPGRGDDVVLRSGGLRTASPSEARSNLAEGVVDAEGAAAPFQRQDPSPRCVVKLRLLSSCFGYLDFFVGNRDVCASESCFSRKVMSEVSVSQRRGSPSARSAFPLTRTFARP